MKKIWAVLIALAVLLSLTACGGGQTEAPTTEPPTETTEAPTEPETEPPTEPPFTIEPVTVLDHERARVSINGIDLTTPGICVVDVEFENKKIESSAANDIKPSLEIRLGLNGIYCPDTLSVHAGIGETTSESCKFETAILDQIGVGDYTDIALQMELFWNDPSGRGGRTERLDVVHFYPQGEENATELDWSPEKEPFLDYENGTFAITHIGSDLNFVKEELNLHGIALDFFVENFVEIESDQSGMVILEDITFTLRDGSKTKPLYGYGLDFKPGKQYVRICWSYGEDIDIEDGAEIQQIDMNVVVRVFSPTKPYQDLATGHVTINP